MNTFGPTTLSPLSFAQTTSSATHVGIALGSSTYGYVLFTDEDGWVKRGYRAEAGVDNCVLSLGAAWEDRHGVLMLAQPPNGGATRLGGLLGSLSVDDAAAFDVLPVPTGYGPGNRPMGTTRWAWSFYPGNLHSVSVVDGAGLSTFAAYDQTILIQDHVITTGPTFLFDHLAVVGGTSIEGIIAESDGISLAAPYTTPPAGSIDSMASYAHTHVAWMRGIGMQDVNKFDSVEVWASAYVPGTSAQAYKVDDYALTSVTSERAGGHGRLATISGRDAPLFGETFVWDIAKKTKKAVVLPEGRRTFSYLGLTLSDLWVAGAPEGGLAPDGLFRFDVSD